MWWAESPQRRYGLDEVETLALRFQAGDEDAGMELLTAFRPYMYKYFTILRNGSMNIDDRDTRKFIRIFIADDDTRYKLRFSWHPKWARKTAYSLAHYVSKLYEYISDDDIWQELGEIMLKLAKRYKRLGDRPMFAGYVANSYRYEVARRVQNNVKDPTIFRWASNLVYQDTPAEDVKQLEFSKLVKVCEDQNESEPLFQIDLMDLSASWIQGITSDYPFDTLLPSERLILKLYILDNQTFRQIGVTLGMHVNTVRRRYHVTLEKVKTRATESRD